MASNLGCVGLAVADHGELSELVERALPHAEVLGEGDGIVVRRWEDPSGSRLVLGSRGDEIVDLLPSFASTPGARLASIEFLSDEVASASVLDEDGEQRTAMAVEIEEHRLLRASSGALDGPAAITALGTDVEVFTSEEAFGRSDASLLSPGEGGSEPPSHYVERGWAWPPRVGGESFISYGLFGPPEEASAHARLAGSVLAARTRTVELTGQTFIEARVRSAGFEAHVCFPAEGRQAPAVGSIVHGTVFLVVSMGRPVAPPRRRPFFRR